MASFSWPFDFTIQMHTPPRPSCKSYHESDVMQSRRSQYKSTAVRGRSNARSLQSAGAMRRYGAGRLNRRMPLYRRLAAGSGSYMNAFRLYQNTGYVTKVAHFRKTISNALSIGGATPLTATGQLTSFSLSNTTPGAVVGGPTWTNNMLDNSWSVGDLSSLRALFELYKIKEIRLRWRLGRLEFTDDTNFPKLYITRVSDLTPAAGVPASEAYFDNKEGVTIHDFTPNSPLFEFVLRDPKIQAPAYTAATWIANTVGYSAVPPRWLDLTDASNVQHHGVAWYIPNIPANQTIHCDIEFAFMCRKHQ